MTNRDQDRLNSARYDSGLKASTKRRGLLTESHRHRAATDAPDEGFLWACFTIQVQLETFFNGERKSWNIVVARSHVEDKPGGFCLFVNFL